MTIEEYKKSKETPAIREWKRKYEMFYWFYAETVAKYQEQITTFKEFMCELKELNRAWRNA